ncbi:MAG: hypothetical protein ABIH34_03480 [Nanoarchaeota archaeon]
MYTSFIRIVSVLLALILISSLFASIAKHMEWRSFWIIAIVIAVFAFFLPRLRK